MKGQKQKLGWRTGEWNVWDWDGVKWSPHPAKSTRFHDQESIYYDQESLGTYPSTPRRYEPTVVGRQSIHLGYHIDTYPISTPYRLSTPAKSIERTERFFDRNCWSHMFDRYLARDHWGQWNPRKQLDFSP